MSGQVVTQPANPNEKAKSKLPKIINSLDQFFLLKYFYLFVSTK